MQLLGLLWELQSQLTVSDGAMILDSNFAMDSYISLHSNEMNMKMALT